MKDRWKILIASLIIGSLLATTLFFLSFSFKKIQLREHGLLEYTFYSTVDPTQTVRSNGNYLIGLNYRFITYPKGILKHEFTVSALTKDKSLVTIQGLFLGELIQSQIINMHFNYGSEYFTLIGKSVQQMFRESLEQFLLTEIISDRQSVNSYISSNVCLNIQAQYSYINCQHVSTGTLNVNAEPKVLPSEQTVQKYLKWLLVKSIAAQKKMNVYENGGFELIQKVEALNADLFLNVTELIVQTVKEFTSEGSQIFAAAAYVLENPMLPLLDNGIPAISYK